MKIEQIASLQILANCQETEPSVSCKHPCRIVSIEGEEREALLEYFTIAFLNLKLNAEKIHFKEPLSCPSTTNPKVQQLVTCGLKINLRPLMKKKIEEQLSLIFAPLS